MKKRKYEIPCFFYKQSAEDIILLSGQAQGIEWDSRWGGLQQ